MRGFQEKRLKAALLAGGALIAFALDAAPAFAEASGDEGANNNEIIVTARRREENVQDVPAAVQVVSADAITKRGILNELDLQTAVPGLVVRTNNNQFQLNYVMRGESFEPYSGSVPGVQPYLNDVALSGNAGPPFYDLQNIQVLKGPQGTLFGRNSTGGAVLYQTHKAGSGTDGYASIQYGRFNKVVAELATNIPLNIDQLKVRVAGTYQDGGDYVLNVYDKQMLGNTRVTSGRISFDLTPAPEFENALMIQYAEVNAENIPKRNIYTAACGVGSAHPCWMVPGNAFYQSFATSPAGTYYPGWPAGSVYTGGLANLPGYLDTFGPYTVDANGTGINRVTDLIVTNATTIELSSSLRLKNIFGYSETHRRSQTDNDNTPYPFLQTGGTTPGNPLEGRESWQTSNELQLQGEAFNNKLNFILGAFLANNRIEYDSPLGGFSYNPTTGVGAAFNIRYRAQIKDHSRAVFGQATIALSDKLNLTLGGRQTWDEIGIKHLTGSLFAAAAPQSTKVSDQSWTVSLDYKASDKLMIYATSRGSWRVGGYNPFVPTGTGNRVTAASGGNYFPPETVRDVEIGFKLADNAGAVPFRLNIDAFYAWMRNIEKTGTTIVNNRVTSATLSVPAGRVTGIEADAMIEPVAGITIGGNVTYNVGKFTDRNAVIFGVPVVYDTFPDTPELSGTVYVEAKFPMGEAGTLLWRSDFYGQTSFHMTSLGKSFNPGDLLPGYGLFNSRLDWKAPFEAEAFTLSVFVKNITNKLYYTGGGGGVQANGTNSANLGLPRTWGAAFRAEF